MNRDTSIRQGQIAHLDKDASNSAESNLAFLCLEHHDQYDSSTRQSKNFTVQEVRHFRDELYAAIESAFGAEALFGKARVDLDPVSGHYIRGGDLDSAEITVRRLQTGQYHVKGLALWGKSREFGPNTGELDFVAELRDEVIEYSYTSEDEESHVVSIHFDETGLTVSEQNWLGAYGMNVNFIGDYAKAT